MKKVAIIGECMIELNGEPFGAMNQTFGGDTLNAAVYLSRAATTPLNIQYVTAMGTDALSEGMIARWQQEGISTGLVLRDEARSPGLYLIQVDDKGERTFLYWRNQSAAKYLLQHNEFGRVEKELGDADMVFVSGISLAILAPEDREKLIELLGELRCRGTEIAFDSNYRPALWPDDQKQTVRQVYGQLLQNCTLALVTFDDEQLIWGDTAPQETIKRLRAAGVARIVVKLGADGCIYSDSSATGVVPTQPVESVVDTTSAGDSFNGGFLSAYLAGQDMQHACQRGNKLAGQVIQHKGAIVPEEVIQL